jgi:hypothetical protein
MYYGNILREKITALRGRTFQNGDTVQMLTPTKPDDQNLGEWELHTVEDMKWNDNHQHPIKYWSQDIT